jgi:starch synthase
MPDCPVDIFFIQYDEYYNRDYLYSTPEGDYWDNSERFIFFSRGVIEAIKMLGLEPDIIQCHDWQSALIPIYLRTIYHKDKTFSHTKTLLTVHNIAYQGVFWHWDMKLTGLDWSLFNWKQLEFWGKINFLKGGLVFANAINTVSQRYSQEIQTPEFGYGLEGALKERARDLYGILNGIDYTYWNPTNDKFIPNNYNGTDLKGKILCKNALQTRVGLPRLKVPLLGMITRLTVQKGLDILDDIFDELMKLDLQLVILGTGEEKYQTKLKELGARYPDKVSVNIAFDNQLAHLITAGADIYLMPSKYEPCGLNQLYALKYGTVPLVRETGGLADTIVNYSAETVKQKTATGFSFRAYTSAALLDTIKLVLQVYQDKKQWLQLMKTGMKQDWSWNRSAKDYIALYQKLIS